MGNKKMLGVAFLVAGALLLIASLAADVMGLGGSTNFGYKQILGVVAGFILAIAGFIFYSRK